jgi:hypothetical protein
MSTCLACSVPVQAPVRFDRASPVLHRIAIDLPALEDIYKLQMALNV